MPPERTSLPRRGCFRVASARSTRAWRVSDADTGGKVPERKAGGQRAGSPRVPLNREFRAAGHSDEEIRELRRAIAAQAEGTGLVLGDGAEQAALTGAAPLPDFLLVP